MGTNTQTDPGARHGVGGRGSAGAVRIGRLAVALAALLTLALVLAARADAFVYWTHFHFGAGAIGRANLDGTGVDPNFITGATSPFGVAVDAGHVYWPNFNPTNTIGRANIDGSGVDQNFITGLNPPPGVAVDVGHVYWTAFSIGRANIDGSGVDQSFIGGIAVPWAVAVDAGHIYWTGNGAIGRANLDGSGVDETFIIGARNPLGVAVDNGHVYWTNSDANSIGRANLDGTGVNQSFITTGSAKPSGLAVDDGHVYWALPDASSIGRANLDGSSPDQSFISTGSAKPIGLAVDALWPQSATPSPRAIDFGDFQVGAATARTVTVRNLGGLPLNIGTVSISGTDQSSFGIDTDNCFNQTLAPGGSCTISVEMTATSLGGKAAALSIPSNDPNGPASVALTGAGVHPDQSITPPSIAFGRQPVGTSSTSRTVTLTNEPSATNPEQVFQAVLVGTDAGQFSVVSDGCSNQTISIGGSCEIEVALAPTSVGVKQASLSIPSNDSTTPATVVLYGTGDPPVAPPPPGPGPPLGPGPVLPGPATPSRPSNRFKVGKLVRNKRKGTAVLRVTLPGPGRIQLTGKLLKRVTKTVTAKTTTSLKLTPTRKAKKTLARRGKLKTRLKVAYTPAGGTTSTQTKRVTLTRSRGSRGRR